VNVLVDHARQRGCVRASDNGATRAAQHEGELVACDAISVRDDDADGSGK
jgi:hypothetical protein